MPADFAEQVDLSLRLVVAAAIGAAIGLERELHAHPAGMRTHLLVSLGAAIFTVLSIAAFRLPVAPSGNIPVDPSRVAAQVVTGIGFLGAGAILKYGSTVKGLTTAASLWATAAMGMAAGTGQWVIAITGTALIVLSLGPLHWLSDRIAARGRRHVRLRLALSDVDALGHVLGEIAARRIEILGIDSERLDADRHAVDLRIRLPAGGQPSEVLGALGTLHGVELMESDRDHEG